MNPSALKDHADRPSKGTVVASVFLFVGLELLVCPYQARGLSLSSSQTPHQTALPPTGHSASCLSSCTCRGRGAPMTSQLHGTCLPLFK